METVLLIDQNPVSWKGLALFADPLVEPCPDHIQEPVKLRAVFHLLDEILHFLNRKIDGGRQVFFEVFKKLTVFQIDLTFFITAAAVETEIERQYP
jgi:hypothetical protein